jgi:hypothetical protein
MLWHCILDNICIVMFLGPKNNLLFISYSTPTYKSIGIVFLLFMKGERKV